MKRSTKTVWCSMTAVWLLAAGAFAYSDPPVNAIPYKKAKRIALKARPGKIKDFQQRQRNDEWVYSFKILCTDQVVREVDVDVLTGKVVYGAKHHSPTR